MYSKMFYEDNHIKIYNKDCRAMTELPDESVQCVVTSPPYWGLRKYSGEQELIWGDKDCGHEWVDRKYLMHSGHGDAQKSGKYSTQEPIPDMPILDNTCALCGAWKGAYGLEPTPELYIEHTIEILREIRRVLRKDGVVFLNLGDSYYGSGKGLYGDGKSHGTEGAKQKTNVGSVGVQRVGQNGKRGKVLSDLKGHDSSFESSDDEYGDCRFCRNLGTDDCPYRELETSIELSNRSHRAQQIDHSDNSDLASQGGHNEVETSGLDSSVKPVDGVARGVQESMPSASSDESHQNPPGLTCSYYQSFQHSASQSNYTTIPHLKAKDLCLIPFKVAIAVQEDGWWVRSDIIWSKPNPMPESVTDRPTNSHEHILMLTKSKKYYWDADAVREPHTWIENRPSGMARQAEQYRGRVKHNDPKYGGGGTGFQGHSGGNKADGTPLNNPAGRNIRSVWEFPTQPYPEAHFAVFPEKLPEICIKAATPEVGCCSKCGAPWERVTRIHDPEGRLGKGYHNHQDDLVRGQRGVFPADGAPTRETTGWQPTCKCNADKVPSIVLDPFAGAGTTLWEAKKLNRRAKGYEISEGYCKLIVDRCRQQVLI